MDSGERMKEIYRNAMNAVASGDVAAFAQMMTEDYRHHGPGGETRDRAAALEMVRGYVTAFPGMQFTLEHMLAEGNHLAVVWRVNGVHSGPLGDVPPTGRSIDIGGHVLCRFEGEKLAEEWEQFDEGLMMKQLGLAGA